MSTDNFAPVICNLAGTTLQVGGACALGYGTLYGIRGISNFLTDGIEAMPKYFEDPGSMFTLDGDGTTRDKLLTKLKEYGVRGGMIMAAVGAGLVLKRCGKYLLAPETIARIVQATS